MEIIYDASCVLWERARVLAKDKGLEMTPNCPVSAHCKETKCIIIESAEEKDRRLSQEKLAALHHELSQMTQG